MIALGVQNDALPMVDLVAQAQSVGAAWTRIVTTTEYNTVDVANRIRAAHDAGLKVVLTVGGIGTDERNPTVTATLKWIDKLPKVEAYTWINEPDLSGKKPVNYGQGWFKLRHKLGSRLWFGDFSPYYGKRYTSVIFEHMKSRLMRIKNLIIAIHPYYVLPRHSTLSEGDMTLPHLNRAQRQLRPLHFRYAITEFGFAPEDEWRWPQALQIANQTNSNLLMIYTADGNTWNTNTLPS